MPLPEQFLVAASLTNFPLIGKNLMQFSNTRVQDLTAFRIDEAGTETTSAIKKYEAKLNLVENQKQQQFYSIQANYKAKAEEREPIETGCKDRKDKYGRVFGSSITGSLS